MEGMMKKKMGVVLTTLLLVVGFAGPAQAASIVKGPYATYSACKSLESAYARAVAIHLPCFQYNGKSWYFAYYV